MTHVTIERAKAQRIADAFEDLKKNHGIVYVEESVDIKQALAAPVQDVDWKDMYEKEKRRSEMWVAKYEKDIGPLEYAVPVAAPVQEPVGYEYHEYRPYGAPGEIRINAILKSRYAMPDGSTAGDYQWLIDQYRANINTIKLIPLYTTAAQPAVPDAIHHTDMSESLEYIQGWNECRQAMLEMMK
jgi:hypothetical protein